VTDYESELTLMQMRQHHAAMQQLAVQQRGLLGASDRGSLLNQYQGYNQSPQAQMQVVATPRVSIATQSEATLLLLGDDE
jgi:hypothetical protein